MFDRDSSSWIWSSEGCSRRPVNGSPSAYEIRRFRRCFLVEDGGDYELGISADSRYLLYLDGRLLGRGPALGDVRHQFYDTYSLSLAPGRHVFAVMVLDYSKVQCDPPHLGAPASVVTLSGGLALELRSSDRDGETALASNADWKVSVDVALRFQPGKENWFGGFIGHFERFVAAAEREPNWREIDFDDTHWEGATELFPTECLRGKTDPMSPYGLLPRMVRFEEKGAPITFKSLFHPGGRAADEGWKRLLEGNEALKLEPNRESVVLLELPEQWTGFPELSFRGGAGAVIRIGYAEALRVDYSEADAVVFGRGKAPKMWRSASRMIEVVGASTVGVDSKGSRISSKPTAGNGTGARTIGERQSLFASRFTRLRKRWSCRGSDSPPVTTLWPRRARSAVQSRYSSECIA